MSEQTRFRARRVVPLVVAASLLASPATFAKSLYVIGDINTGQAPILAYDLQPPPAYLVPQSTTLVPYYAGGAVGIAIDTDSAVLFVTYEGSNVLQLVDAVTMTPLGSTTAPGAWNLAGIVVDQEKKLVYTVDRGSNSLWVYQWDAVAKTLTLATQQSLPGVSDAHGIALDEVRDLLFVADRGSTTVRYFSTADWSQAGSFSVTQPPAGIAVDAKNQLVYTGNPLRWSGYGGLGLLSKYDLKTGVETTVDIAAVTGVAGDNVVGLAVDPQSSLLYLTTGDQASGGSDLVMVFDSDLAALKQTGPLGQQGPTGLCVPGKQISYNPLHLVKEDGLAEGVCASRNLPVSFSICYDNLANSWDVDAVSIVDTLPPELEFVSATGGGVYDPVAGTVTWAIGAVPAGTPPACVDLTANIAAGTPPGASLANYATISGAQTGQTTVVEYTDVCTNQPPVALCADVSAPADEACRATASIDDGSYDPDGDPIELTQDPLSFELGDTLATLLVADDGGLRASCQARVTVFDAMPPNLVCPEPITLECTGPEGASASFEAVATDNCTAPAVACSPASGSVFPLGTSDISCTASDGSNGASCSSSIQVVDTAAPTVSCVPSVNPGGVNVPAAGQNPKSGQNPDGFYQVAAADLCTAAPTITLGGFKLASGETIKITNSPGASGVRLVNTMGAAGIKHFQVGPGDAVLVATDGSGNVAKVFCAVPPPPK